MREVDQVCHGGAQLADQAVLLPGGELVSQFFEVRGQLAEILLELPAEAPGLLPSPFPKARGHFPHAPGEVALLHFGRLAVQGFGAARADRGQRLGGLLEIAAQALGVASQ